MFRAVCASSGGRIMSSLISGTQYSPDGVLHSAKPSSRRMMRLAWAISLVAACCRNLMRPSRLAFQTEQYGLLILTSGDNIISDDGLRRTQTATESMATADATTAMRESFIRP